MKIILTLILAVLFSNIKSQERKYYKFPDDQIFSESVYLSFKNNEKLSKEMTFSLIDSISRTDSLIYIVDIKPVKTFINSPNSKLSDQGPFAKFNKFLGTKFKFEKFTNENNILDSIKNSNKPTVINFWFTNCGPCIAEFSFLNSLKTKFNTKVNFVAITFDNKEKVEKLLKSKPFNYLQLTNQKNGIDSYEIISYPLTMILNNNSEIVDIKGDIYNFKEETEKLLNELL